MFLYFLLLSRLMVAQGTGHTAKLCTLLKKPTLDQDFLRVNIIHSFNTFLVNIFKTLQICGRCCYLLFPKHVCDGLCMYLCFHAFSILSLGKSAYCAQWWQNTNV